MIPTHGLLLSRGAATGSLAQEICRRCGCSSRAISRTLSGARQLIRVLTLPGALPQSMRAMGITDRPSWMALFSSHPPVEQRIAALQALGR